MTVSLPRFAGRTAIVLGAVCTLGMWPVSRWESTQGIVAWSVAFAVVFVGAVLGAAPLASKFARRSPENMPQAWLIGFGIRMLFVLSACLIVWVSRPFPPHPFLLGAALGYGVVLAYEIATASRMMQAMPVSVEIVGGGGAGVEATPKALARESNPVGDWAR